METNTTQESVAKVEGLYHVLKGGTVLHGAELVPDKVCAIISEILVLEPDTGLINLVFRGDGYPDDCMGMAYVDTHSVAINLEGIFKISCDIAKDEKNLSLRGILWTNLLSTILHDIHHVLYGYTDREDLEAKKNGEKGTALLDDEADDWAKEMMVKLARKVDIEPPMMAEFGFFAAKFMELMSTKAVEEDWLGHHLGLIEAGMIYVNAEQDIEIKTYREYLRQTMDSKNEQDPEWEQAVSAIDMVCRLENGSIEVAKTIEPVAAPVIETQTESIEVPAEVEAEVAVIAAAGAVVGQEGTEIVVPANTPIKEAVVDGFRKKVLVVGNAADASPEMQAGSQQPLFAVDMPAEIPIENDGAGMAEAAAVEQSITNGDAVPLPEAVALEQQQIANAANVTIPGPNTPTTYLDNGLTAEVITQTLQTIYQRLYHHIFTKCERQLNSAVGFNKPQAVLTAVQAGDIIQRFGAEDLVKEYDTINATGQYASEQFTGYIRGTIMKKTQLPAYDLFLNIGGRRLARRLVPQNPSKMKDGQYTQSADEARTGHAIMWIIDRDAKKELGQKAFVAKIRDNVYEAL